MKTSVVPPMLLFHLVMVGVSTANFLSNDRCPPVWWFYEAEYTCIKFYFQRQPFNESREICKEELADLVSIQNEEKNTFISYLMKQANTWSSWIGVYHQSGETYVLASGSELPYENWEPNGVQKGPDKCVELQVDISNVWFTDKSWDTSECRSVNHFTCEKRAECPRGWTQYQSVDMCWFFPPNVSSHHEARRICNFYGAQIATVRNRESENLIRDKAGERSQGLHIGVWDASRNGTYMNPGGTPQIHFYPWAEGFPLNPRRRQYCLDMDSNGLWRNIGCVSRRSFICEKDRHPEDFSSRCPDDWTPYPIDETCLRFNETRTSWGSARRECQRQDGDLVQVFDQSKAHQVHDLGGAQIVSIGIHDRDRDGIWKSVDGRPMLNQLWWHGNGRLHDHRFCAVLYRYHNQEKLVFKRHNCRSWQPFVCETPMADTE